MRHLNESPAIPTDVKAELKTLIETAQREVEKENLEAMEKLEKSLGAMEERVNSFIYDSRGRVETSEKEIKAEPPPSSQTEEPIVQKKDKEDTKPFKVYS